MLLKNVIEFLTRKIRKITQSRKFIITLVAGSLISVISTYAIIARSSVPFGSSPKIIMGFLILDLIFLLLLIITITKKYISIFASRRKNGYRLQSRIVLMFSLVFSIPTIIISIFSYLFFSYGIESWFNDRVSNALEQSVIVSESYLNEHKEAIKLDAIKMANVIESIGFLPFHTQEKFNKFLDIEASVRSLTEIIIFKPNKIIAQNSLSFALVFSQLPLEQMEKAANGEVILLLDNKIDKVRALVKLTNLFNTYVIIGRPIDQNILYHVNKTRGEVSEYNKLKSEISETQIRFAIIFVILSLILLMIAISVGIIFTGLITKPINDLLFATEKIQKGDFSFRVIEGPENDEIAILTRAFNSMVNKLNTQRNELVDANEEIDAKRHFSETILSGVSAGIIVLNTNGKIAMINRSASKFVSKEPQNMIGNRFEEHFPQMENLLTKVMKNPDVLISQELETSFENQKFVFFLRIVAESFSNNVTGYIVSFDDVTDLMIAQRNIAWSDIARKVAHEIKNPLTPIQLAAERINRKYEKSIQPEEKETFARYVDTIKRHVSDIRKMVEEFVEFARMPSAVIEKNDLMKLVNNTIFSRKCLQNNIEYLSKNEDNYKAILNFDKSQIERLLINLIKNAEESLQEKCEKNKNNNEFLPIITIEILEDQQYITLMISDNGTGFGGSGFGKLIMPDSNSTANKPYVTTKPDGSGLGLAIVNKIVKDHNGKIEFSNLEIGAEVKILLPKK